MQTSQLPSSVNVCCIVFELVYSLLIQLLKKSNYLKSQHDFSVYELAS